MDACMYLCMYVFPHALFELPRGLFETLSTPPSYAYAQYYDGIQPILPALTHSLTGLYCAKQR